LLQKKLFPVNAVLIKKDPEKNRLIPQKWAIIDNNKKRI